jgi:hypothetical protein
MFEALLSIGTIESITLINSLSIEAAGPLVTSPAAGVGLGVGVGLAGAAVLAAVFIHERRAE